MEDRLNKALSIQVSLNGLSFCIKNTDQNTIDYLQYLGFGQKETPFKILEALEAELDKEIYAHTDFSSVLVIHRNELSTFVPGEYFLDRRLADYLKFNSKILHNDFVSYDNIKNKEICNVYVPLINVNNFLVEKFGEIVYKHSSTILLDYLQYHRKTNQVKAFINKEDDAFEMMVMNGSQLLFYNIFDFETPEDFGYYILFTFEQLGLDREKIPLRFLGGVKQTDPFFEICYKYIRDVDVQTDSNHIPDAESDGHNHFILLQSFEQ